jgi:hypothetical protein
MAHIFASDRSKGAAAPTARKTRRFADRAPEQALASLQARADRSHPTARLAQMQADGGSPVQLIEEEEPLQGRAIQRLEEEEPLQGKAIQRMDEEELMQGKAVNGALQRTEATASTGGGNGLPGQLQHGIRQLSGADVSDVNVHYNSPAPAKVGAHAYAQGRDIHLASGQEKHLPHEAWHVVQQQQGRVSPTIDVAGTPVNDDPGLEREADVMGSRASQLTDKSSGR